jgi:CRP/FNR family cyclic AMP-dependent transcriptional regulator
MDETGKEIVLDTKGPGDYFGEMALLDDAPRSASVTSLEKSSLLVIQGREFRTYLSTRPNIAINLLEALSHRIRHLNEQVKDLALKDVYTRLVKVFRQLGEKEEGRYVIRQKMTHQDLANRVGSSREMVSRIVHDLMEGGYIKKEKNRLIISETLPPRW